MTDGSKMLAQDKDGLYVILSSIYLIRSMLTTVFDQIWH